jgi:hypothetical protein
VSRSAKNENAGGVPEISRGLSDQRERYPRSTSKTSRTLEGCKNVLFTAPGCATPSGSGELFIWFPGVSLRSLPLNPRLISRIPSGCRSADSASRSTLRATDALDLSKRWAAGNAHADHRPALLWLRLRRAALYRRFVIGRTLLAGGGWQVINGSTGANLQDSHDLVMVRFPTAGRNYFFLSR